MQKIHETVEKWKETQIKESEIYKSRDVFLEVLNKMLLKKEVFVNNENVLEVKKSNGETFPINALSSGEKQLLILFGEALLQENRSFIFIADEPELSLHVDWQEQLVKNIRSINPKAQMIVATHSPDIISDYRDKAQDIESLLS
jgi:predicted ATPase